MSPLRRIAALVAAATVTTVLLAGCSGATTPAASTPTVTVTVTATARPTATPTSTSAATPDSSSAKTVTLGADGLTVTASEGTITAGYFDGVVPAVNALSAVLGTVKPTFLAAGKCNSDQTTYDWGVLKLTYQGSDASADTTFVLQSSMAPTTVDVETALGARVGGDYKTYFAKLPSSQPSHSDGTYDSVLESSAAGAGSSTSGTVVLATNGVISSIAVPQDFNADC